MKDKAKTDTTVDAKPFRFTWKIDNFSKVTVKKLYSDHFICRGHVWRILIFPKGNNVDNLSIYLDASNSMLSLPERLKISCQFHLSVVNQTHYGSSKTKSTSHKFNSAASDFGFTSFMPLGELFDQSRGYLVNDTCIVEAIIDKLSGYYEGEEEEEKEEEEEEEEEEKEKECTDMDNEMNTSSFAVFDEIENLLGENASGSNYSNSFSTEEIADAERVFEECLAMDITSVIYHGKVPEFIKSLSIFLSRKSFPTDTIERATKISDNFVQICDQFETAHQSLREARENEVSVSESKASLKRLLGRFMLARNEAEAVDQEIARLQKQIASRKAHQVALAKKLKDLTAQATSSKDALVCAEEKMKLSDVRKEQAEKVIEDVIQSWEFLKDLPDRKADRGRPNSAYESCCN